MQLVDVAELPVGRGRTATGSSSDVVAGGRVLVGVVEEVLAELARGVVGVGGGRGHACNAAEDGGGVEGRGDIVALAVELDHEDGDFEGRVDLGVGHEVSSDDAVFDVGLWGLVDGGGFIAVVVVVIATAAVVVAAFAGGQGGRGRKAAPLAAVALRGGRGRAIVGRNGGSVSGASRPVPRVSYHSLALLDVLAQVEGQLAQGDALLPGPDPRGREFLQDLELDDAFGQVVCLVDGDAHGEDLGVVVLDAVVCDGALAGAAAVLAMDGVWQVPFDLGEALDQWHVV